MFLYKELPEAVLRFLDATVAMGDSDNLANERFHPSLT